MLRKPGSAIVIVITLGLVTGAASAIFAVLNATLLRPLPFPSPDRLVRVFAQPPGTTAARNRTPLHAIDYVRFRERSQLLESVEGFWPLSRSLSEGSEPEVISAAGASPGVFALLGGTPVLGRTFTADEDRAGSRLVVLSHAFWQQRFGGDRSIVGRSLLVDREPYDVIGVMNAEFEPGFFPAQLWTPLGIHQGHLPLPTSGFVQGFGLLRPGVSTEQASAELAAIMAGLAHERPTTHAGWGAVVDDVRAVQFGDRRAPMFVLMAAALGLALLAATNLANLALAEILSRRAETSLRLALGSEPRQIVVSHVIESAVLGVLGCLLGLLLAFVTLPMVLSIDPVAASFLGDVRVDLRVAAIAAIIAVGTSLTARLVPLRRELRSDLAFSVTDDGRRATASRGASRVRFILVAAQTGLALMLLVAGALLVSTFVRDSRIDTGYRAAGVVAMRLRLSETAYPTIQARSTFAAAMLDRIRQLRNVDAAGIATNQLVPGASYVTLVHVEGQPTPDGQPHTVQFRRVSPDYFRTLRVPQVSGRDVAATDGIEQMPVAVVSRTFADRFWPNQDPLGRRLRRAGQDNPWMTVVGVVGDVRDYDLGIAPEPMLYIPFAQFNTSIAPIMLVVRAASGDPLDLAPAIRSAILSVDPLQPVDRVVALDSFLSETVGSQRFQATLLMLFATLGLLLAGTGVYAVTARSLLEQTSELGIRLALGASRRSIWVLVIGRSLRAVVAGLVGGALAATVMIAVIRRILPSLEDFQLTMAVVPGVTLVLVAALACGWPAFTAVRLDPVLALRRQ